MKHLDRAIDLLRASRSPVAFTGAGMSADSGLSTFRDVHTGLWSQWSPEELATPDAYRRDKALVWGWYVWRMAQILRTQPNAGHLALARLERERPELAVITQNVDDLHERAGSTRIAHLHGEIFAHRCFTCGQAATFDVPPEAADSPTLRLMPPRCRHCDGHLRPGVVWFGEALPRSAWQLASDWTTGCDLLLVIGTSGVVQPAASLVERARDNDAHIILVDPAETAHSHLADVHLQGAAHEMLPKLLQP